MGGRRVAVYMPLLALLLSGCGALGARGWPGVRGLERFESNGARIYFTGRNDRGARIPSSGGPSFGMMMGRPTCASCHGADGRGGVHVMHMQVMDAPDIRWGSLTSGEHGEHGHDSEEGEEEPYDEEAFKRAVREGIGPGGHRLSTDMPRWRISDRDLEDLIVFLQELP